MKHTHSDFIKKNATLEEQLYFLGIFFLLLGALGGILYFHFYLPYIPMLPCMFHELFGLYCPGCGGTRAIMSLFHGNILRSVWYHPMVLYGFVIFGGFMLSHTLARLHVPKIKGWRFHNWYLYGAVVLVAANFLLKNILKICFAITLE